MRTTALLSTVALVCGSWAMMAEAAGPDAPILQSPQQGAVQLKGIDALRFAPGAVLLVGDGRGGQVVAIETGDTTPLAGPGAKVPNVTAVLADRLGTKAADVEILDLAVNPISGRAYLAVRKQDEPRDLIVTIDPRNGIKEFLLKDVRYVRVALASDGKGAPPVHVTDLAWAGDRLIVAAQAKEEFASKVLVVPGPLSDASSAAAHSAETYHVSHRRWETKAPMSTIMPYQEEGKWYVVGAFSCTPIVKYPVEDLKPDAHVKGLSMLELGSGNKPLNMFAYEKDGKASVLVNTFRFHHQKAPISPGPYWTCRFNLDLLANNEKVNEEAVRRDIKTPEDPAISMVPEFHGVMHMDRLDAGRALVVRKGADDSLDLEAVALP